MITKTEQKINKYLLAVLIMTGCIVFITIIFLIVLKKRNKNAFKFQAQKSSSEMDVYTLKN